MVKVLVNDRYFTVRMTFSLPTGWAQKITP